MCVHLPFLMNICSYNSGKGGMEIGIKGNLWHYRALVSLGVPIVVGQIGNVVLGFADTLMIGHHSMEELAAASFVNVMFTLIVVFSMGFSYGLTPIVGNHFGRGESNQIGSVLRHSLIANTLLAILLLFISIVFYLNLHRLGQPEELLPLMRPYLLVNIVSLPFLCWFNAFKQFFDGITDTRIPMYVIIFGNVLNIIGNYLLIYGVCGLPEMGLLGAGLSTMASRIVMCLACVGVFFMRKRYREYRNSLLNAPFSFFIFRRLNALGWPVAMQLGMETASFSLAAIFVGWVGTTALAAHQVMLTISQILYMIHSGMAAAVAVRVSYFHGQHDLQAVRTTAHCGFHIVLTIALVLSIPIFLLRWKVSYWFTDGDDVALLVANAVIPLVVYQFGDTLQYTFANALRGVSRVRPMIYAAFFAYFVISLPLSYLFGIRMGVGLVGIWWAFPIGLTSAGIFYYACFRKALREETAKLALYSK